jgi:hypothetical protein
VNADAGDSTADGSTDNLAEDDASSESPTVTLFTNPVEPMDVNNDGLITPQDPLFIINALAEQEPGVALFTTELAGGSGYLDVNEDGLVVPLDALIVINYLNAQTPDGGEAELVIAADSSNMDGLTSSPATRFAEAAERSNSEIEVRLHLPLDTEALTASSTSQAHDETTEESAGRLSKVAPAFPSAEKQKHSSGVDDRVLAISEFAPWEESLDEIVDDLKTQWFESS